MQTLCASCGHVREVVAGTGSRFLLCRLSQQDKRYAKYPPQPVVHCSGYRDQAAAASSFKLETISGSYVVCRLPAEAEIPSWATGQLVSITRTADELSIVCSSESAPNDVRRESGWRALRVVGPLHFAMVGVIAGLTAALAAASISVFVISSFDTDYLLVKEERLESAIKSLRAAGHQVA